MNHTIGINDKVLDDVNIRGQHLYLFLQLVKLADEDGVVIFTLTDLIRILKTNNKTTILGYLKVLMENGYITKLDFTDKKSTYKLNKEYYYK